MALDKLVSIKDAAKILGGVSHWTVRQWLAAGRLQTVKVGSRTMLRERDLRRFINEGARLGRGRVRAHKEQA